MQGSPKGKRLLVLGALIGALAIPQAAQAAPPASVFGGAVTCTVQGDGVDFCGSSSPRSTAPAFDGVPIDVNVAFPNEAQFGSGPYPLMMMFHGYGGGKLTLANMHRWLDQGYATFSMTDRGFRESCGSAAAKTAGGAACDNGYVRLIDNRYEVRDAQEFAGQLADQGLVQPKKIGAIGGSYGGGMSMALGALKNRKVLPNYSLVPWTSPGGTPMEIAAAAPNIPWTDLAYSLAPNGSTLDYVKNAPYTGRVGVEKQSFVTGLYLSGLGAPGFYAPAGFDPTADLIGWQTKLEQGEPYGAEAQGIINELTQHHSSYYIDHTIAPAPMLMSSGFTDDLFPADETIRYYNRTRSEYPNADLSLFFGDFGHMRGQNKADVTAALVADENAWMNHFVKGVGDKPAEGVTAYTETCPNTAPSGGPFKAANWAQIAPGEIRFDSDAAQTIAPDSTTGGAFDPVSGGNACTTKPSTDTSGAAVYKLDAAPSGGYTMMGAATVIADFTLPGDTSQVAARLLDVAPGGTETLVDRGLWRPATGGPTRQVFQLHPNGWNFAEGHVPKLELIAADADSSALANYGRPSNNQQPVTVQNLELRLPVVEKPGSFGGLVGSPAKKFLPANYELAADFAALSSPHPSLAGKKLKVKGKNLVGGKISCPAEFVACDHLEAVATGKVGGHKKAVTVAKGKIASIAGGETRGLKLKLTGKGKKYFRDHSKLKLTIEITSDEVAESTIQKAKAVAKHKHG